MPVKNIQAWGTSAIWTCDTYEYNTSIKQYISNNLKVIVGWKPVNISFSTILSYIYI